MDATSCTRWRERAAHAAARWCGLNEWDMARLTDDFCAFAAEVAREQATAEIGFWGFVDFCQAWLTYYPAHPLFANPDSDEPGPRFAGLIRAAVVEIERHRAAAIRSDGAVSKASEWAATNAKRPTFRVANGDVGAEVSQEGKCNFIMRGTASREASPEHALALARWILDIFGDAP